MLIDVHVNLYRCNRIVSVDASTLHVVVERLLDLYDSYMRQAEEKRKAAYGGQLSFEDILGGDSSAG